jgi:hypothetical protein
LGPLINRSDGYEPSRDRRLTVLKAGLRKCIALRRIDRPMIVGPVGSMIDGSSVVARPPLRIRISRSRGFEGSIIHRHCNSTRPHPPGTGWVAVWPAVGRSSGDDVVSNICMYTDVLETVDSIKARGSWPICCSRARGTASRPISLFERCRSSPMNPWGIIEIDNVNRTRERHAATADMLERIKQGGHGRYAREQWRSTAGCPICLFESG